MRLRIAWRVDLRQRTWRHLQAEREQRPGRAKISRTGACPAERLLSPGEPRRQSQCTGIGRSAAQIGGTTAWRTSRRGLEPRVMFERCRQVVHRTRACSWSLRIKSARTMVTQAGPGAGCAIVCRLPYRSGIWISSFARGETMTGYARCCSRGWPTGCPGCGCAPGPRSRTRQGRGGRHGSCLESRWRWCGSRIRPCGLPSDSRRWGILWCRHQRRASPQACRRSSTRGRPARCQVRGVCTRPRTSGRVVPRPLSSLSTGPSGSHGPSYPYRLLQA